MMANILITGAGAPGIAGTIYALRNNPDNRDFNITTTDIKNDCTGKYMSDNFYTLPEPESPEYEEAVKKIIKKENISIILPQTTREIEFYSKNRKRFADLNVGVVVSEYPGIQRANDKYLIIEACEESGVAYPQYFLAKSIKELETSIKSLGYPQRKVVIKPRHSNGLRGVRILSEEGLSFQKYLYEKPFELGMDMESFMKIFSGITSEEFPELLVTEYMPGDEYSVDLFRNNKGSVIIPRLRKSIRSGISFETKVDLSQTELIKFSGLLASHLDLIYCFGFQFKLDTEGVPKILESNPRVQGTMVASVFAGFNMIYYAVKECLGEEVNLDAVRLIDKSEFKRYWGGIGISENGYSVI